MNLAKQDIAILLGLLLGDGYIDPRGQIQVKHCAKQKEYCEFKAKLLHTVCGGKDIKVLKNTRYKKEFKNKWYIEYSFKKQSKHFKWIRNLLYCNNKKTITRDVLCYLSPLSIALWWMDDGTLTRKKQKDGSPGPYMLRLCTYLSKEQNKLIQQYFIDKYDMKWNVVPADGDKTHTQFMLRCGQTEGRKFLNIIRDQVLKVPCMSYKIIDI